MKKINNEFDVKFERENRTKYVPKINKSPNIKPQIIEKEKSSKFKWVMGIAIIIFLFWFLTLVSEGYFKAEVNQNQDVNVDPKVEVNNQYNFTPIINNEYYHNITIINKIYLNQTG